MTDLGDKVMDALDSLWVSGNRVVGKLHARDELLALVRDERAQADTAALQRAATVLQEKYPYAAQALAMAAAMDQMERATPLRGEPGD